VKVAVLKGLHHVKRKLADGSVAHHYYAWRGGPKITAKPGSEAFNAEFFRLRAERDKVEIDTLEGLIEHFTGPENKRNPDFLALAETTQAEHLYAFKLVKKEWPRLPARLTQQKGMKAEIRKWHRSFAANPRKADKLLFSLSKIFSYAIADELIEKNPCTGIERLYAGSRRERVWTSDLIAGFRKSAPSHLLLPFEIAISTGQRQGDILSLPWKAYDGTYLQFDQAKTQKRLKVKVHSKLKAMLDALPHDKLRICLNSRKRPWTKDGFKSSWGKEIDRLVEAGIPALATVTFHDLRGTFITERAREGSTAEQIAKISGHSIAEVKSVLEKHYLATDQEASDAVILRMERTGRERKV
jgi:integrase